MGVRLGGPMRGPGGGVRVGERLSSGSERRPDGRESGPLHQPSPGCDPGSRLPPAPGGAHQDGARLPEGVGDGRRARDDVHRGGLRRPPDGPGHPPVLRRRRGRLLRRRALPLVEQAPQPLGALLDRLGGGRGTGRAFARSVRRTRPSSCAGRPCREGRSASSRACSRG